MSWTLSDLIQKAQREQVTLSDLGRRGGKKAARLKKQKRKQQSQLTLAL